MSAHPSEAPASPLADPNEVSAAARDAPVELAALALDVLTRQAEGRLLFAGKEHVARRAEALGVSPESARLLGEDVLVLLEEGPQNSRGRALVTALAVAGLAPHLAEPDRLARFVAHADWLALASPYDEVHAFIDPVLGASAGPIWEALGRGVPEGDSPAAVAGRALRLAALSASAHPSARAVLEALARGPAARLARAFDVAAEPVLPQVEGTPRRAPAPGLPGLLRWVSGWAALQWLGRGLLWLLGVRRQTRLTLGPEGLREHALTHVAGRLVRERERSWTLLALAGAGRAERWPAAPLLAGGLAFALGVGLGGMWLFEGVRSGETVLLFVGAAALAL
ncbi:MAG: hypothetical protein AAF447_26480, partial [Myxococcota bacterium]